MKKLLFLTLTLACTLPALSLGADIPGVAPESPVTFGGYVKYLVTGAIPDSGSDTVDHLIHQRFNFEYRPTDEVSFVAGLRNRFFYGDSLDTFGFRERVGDDPGYWDLSKNWLEKEDLLANSTLDRLYIDWRPGVYQARAGRHRINWGMSTLWNPNDLFNVYSTFDFDYIERPGTDALLLGRDLGFASRVEAVWGFGDDWDHSSLAWRYQFNTLGYDIQLLAGKNGGDTVFGAGFSGSLFEAGVRGEVSRFDPHLDVLDGEKLERVTVATLEADYSVSGPLNLIWKVDLLYISNPDYPATAALFLARTLSAKTLSFTRWTGYGELSFEITPLSRQTFGSSYYDDDSWYVTAGNSYSLVENVDLQLVWQHYDGGGGSLFGADPSDLLFGSLRWSF